MDRLISRTQRVCLATALFSLLAVLPGSAHARSSGGASAIAVSPGGIAFPEKVSGVSGEQSWPKRLKISVSAKSGQPVTIKSISIGGADAADFAVHQAGNCVGATLTTGCAVTVTFRPTGLGARTATLTVADSSGANVRTVVLSGRGIKASIKWQPREISFGKIRPGATSTPEPVSITNPNAAPISIKAISLKSPDFTAFQTQSCVGQLAPHASCRFYVGANPPSSMTKSRKNSIKAELQIKDNAAGSPHNVALSAVLNGSPLPPPPPPAPANLTHEILVTNTPCNNVTDYVIGAGGNAAPNFPQPLLCNPTGIALDANKNIYVTNSGIDGNPSYSIAVYPNGSAGQVAPSSVIAGAATGLDIPTGIALDASGKIYVVNDGSNNGDPDSVTIYPAGSSGNATPSAVISGSSTGLNLPSAIAIDSVGQEIYVANFANNTVTVYPTNGNGNVAPSATIRGFSTGLLNPTGIALDSAVNIYVTNSNVTVTVYPAGSTGNAIPTAIISNGLFDPEGIALDSGNNIYVADFNQVVVYPAGSITGATPSTTIVGPATLLDASQAVAVDSTGNIYVANDGNVNRASDTVTVYPSGLTGTVDQAPTTTINSEFALTNNGMAQPVGIALDSSANIYVTNEVQEAVGSSFETVQVYSAGSGATGAIDTNIGTIFSSNPATGIALDSGQNVYLVGPKPAEVDIFSPFDAFSFLAALNGDVSLLSDPADIAVDANGNMYVTNDATDIIGDRVTVYPAGSSGNTAPIAVIVGSNTGLAFPAGIAVDSTNIYVANKATDSVTVYPLASNGNVAPIATISGPNTGLNTPSGIALDSSGLIYVANEGGYEGNNISVTIYAAGASGNATPVTTVAGPSTQLARPGGVAVVPSMATATPTATATPIIGSRVVP